MYFQEAAKSTSEMLQDLKKLREDDRETGNVLVAVDELEKFGLVYAEKHLSNTNATIQLEFGENLGMS